MKVRELAELLAAENQEALVVIRDEAGDAHIGGIGSAPGRFALLAGCWASQGE
jgi:hypothetical protein